VAPRHCSASRRNPNCGRSLLLQQPDASHAFLRGHSKPLARQDRWVAIRRLTLKDASRVAALASPAKTMPIPSATTAALAKIIVFIVGLLISDLSWRGHPGILLQDLSTALRGRSLSCYRREEASQPLIYGTRPIRQRCCANQTKSNRFTRIGGLCFARY
jgi:hypothetical protein